MRSERILKLMLFKLRRRLLILHALFAVETDMSGTIVGVTQKILGTASVFIRRARRKEKRMKRSLTQTASQQISNQR